MFKFSTKDEYGETYETVRQYTGPISSSSSTADPGLGGNLVVLDKPGAVPPPDFVKSKFSLVIGDGDDEPDGRTELHRAKAKRLIESMVPSRLEEIGTTTWVKKMNAWAVITNGQDTPDLEKDGEILDHLVRHKKVTVLVRDLILIVVWRDEILPKLLEMKQEQTTAATQGQGSCAKLQRSTITMVVSHALNLSDLMSALLSRPEVLVALGHDLHDLIDYAVGEIRYFIENPPVYDPARDKLVNKHDPVEASWKLGSMDYDLQCSHAPTILSFFYAILDKKVIDKIPAHVLVKLIHPDTKYVVTLVDFVLTRPSKGTYGFAEYKPETNRARSRYQTAKCAKDPLNSLEAALWNLIHFVFIDARFPVSAVSQLTQECFDKLMLIRPLLQSERLMKAMPELKDLKNFLCQLAAKPPKLMIPNEQLPEAAAGESEFWVPPSPNFVKIRAELESNRDAMIRIHTAMGTFEAENMNDACRRQARDYYSFFPLYDMNKCCFYCAKADAGLRCSRCQYARYCDKKCQSKNWANHKLICSH